MKNNLEEKQMMQAIHILLQDDKEYNARIIRDLTEEEFKSFLRQCPEFLEEIP
ncbi:hypothetical protein HMPREF9477_01270 [Lachnospiraceae bacterium 2_1_46FAA]|nr:hypothetical protein HMPREF9477_01270 [Lachnospiraceae bacterium 2_1_46FAA]